MDLDSLDNDVLSHLYEEIESPDWDFIIAHFLGVDHCGHRYGPNHPQMEVKLRQMNQVVANVSAMIEEDSLLVVIGDHGMTSTGDHGGDSEKEIESALFFYSPSLHLRSEDGTNVDSVSQIDLVPTLASLVGVPIPFSNLGKVIEQVVDVSHVSNCSVQDIIYLNYQQVQRYLNLYKLDHEFPEDFWQQLKAISKSIDEEKINAKKKLLMVQFLTLARSMCQEVWVKFDIFNIILGLISFSCLLLSIVCILPKRASTILLHFRHTLIIFLLVNSLYGISLFFVQKRLNLIVSLCFMFFSLIVFKTIPPYGCNFSSLVFVSLMGLGSFSNSFVVVEDLVCSYLFLSLLTFSIGGFLFQKFKIYLKSKPQRLSSHFSYYDLVLFSLLLAIFSCVRFSRMFLMCREEQHWCVPPSFLYLDMSSLSKQLQNVRYFTSILSLIAVILVPRKLLQCWGNLNGWEMGVVVAKTFPVLCGLLTGFFWALQSVPSISKASNISRLTVYLPQMLYLIAVIGIAVINYNPLLVFLVPPSEDMLATAGSPVIPQLFMKLKQTYEHRSRKPRVYGLATSVSAPLLVLFSLVALPAIIIAGDGATPAMLLLFTTGGLVLIFHSFLTWKTANSIESLLAPNWGSITLWFLLSVHGFYTTGHQATFPSLNWVSGFVGYDGEGSHLVPALLILLNTFSSHLLFGLTLPLLLTVPLSIGFLWPTIKLNKPQVEPGNRGEFLLVERPKEAKESLVSSGLIYIAFHSLKVLMTSISAFFLRRHLMVWKIFAPHFIFEAFGLMFSCIGVVAGCLFAFRALSALEAWSQKL
ncbi:UNVERIFIED_CONTAM: hypothetical protein GTU68_026925 [Idotea baltica]|nr:hypothetical protein [Idotea baltica]